MRIYRLPAVSREAIKLVDLETRLDENYLTDLAGKYTRENQELALWVYRLGEERGEQYKGVVARTFVSSLRLFEKQLEADAGSAVCLPLVDAGTIEDVSAEHDRDRDFLEALEEKYQGSNSEMVDWLDRLTKSACKECGDTAIYTALMVWRFLEHRIEKDNTKRDQSIGYEIWP